MMCSIANDLVLDPDFQNAKLSRAGGAAIRCLFVGGKPNADSTKWVLRFFLLQQLQLCGQGETR